MRAVVPEELLEERRRLGLGVALRLVERRLQVRTDLGIEDV